jgi:hypothetical protein
MSFGVATEDRKEFEQAKLTDAWKYYTGDTFLCTCKEVMRRQLFSEGMDFCIGHCEKKRKRKTTLVDQELIDDFWMPFAHDVLDCILVFGFVPVTFLEVNGQRVPKVPPADTYTVARVFDAETMTLNIVATAKTALLTKGRKKAELIVMQNYGYDPDYDTKLTSLVAAILPQVSYLNTARAQAVVRGELCNHPTLFAVSEEKAADPEAGVTFDFWGDTSGALKEGGENTFQRDAREQNIYATQKRMFDAALRGNADVHIKSANADPQLHKLTPGDKIHQPRMASGAINVIEATKVYEQTVCAVLGIPRSMLINDSAVKADVAGTHAIFRRTMLHWSRLLARILTEVHSHIPNETASKKLKRGRKMSTKDLYALKAREGVTVSFPIGLFGTTQAEIFDMYAKNMLTYEQYAEYSLKLAGIPEEAFGSPADPLSETEKKSLYVPLVLQQDAAESQRRLQATMLKARPGAALGVPQPKIQRNPPDFSKP